MISGMFSGMSFGMISGMSFGIFMEFWNVYGIFVNKCENTSFLLANLNVCSTGPTKSAHPHVLCAEPDTLPNKNKKRVQR